MAKKFSPRLAPQRSAPNSVVSLAYKPAKIGPVLAGIMKAKNKDEEVVALYMDKTVRTVQNWLKHTYLTVPVMMKLSELLQTDLMILYHPNVPHPENPLAAEVARLKEKVESLLEDKEKKEDLEKENLILKGKLEEAQDELDKWRNVRR